MKTLLLTFCLLLAPTPVIGAAPSTAPATRPAFAVEAPDAPGDAKADPIHAVATFADLLRQPPKRVGGWDVRVGVADPGDALGPAAVLYALADWAGTGPPTPISGGGPHPLGPLAARWQWGKRETIIQLRSVAEWGQKGTRLLFAAAIPLRTNGQCRIDLCENRRNGGGDAPTLWAATLVVSEAPRPVWGVFARPTSPTESDGVVADEVYTAVPKVDGTVPIFAGDPKDASRWAGPLPLLDAADAKDSPLTLALADGRFVLTSTRPLVDFNAPEQLLARWWVNGRPIRRAAIRAAPQRPMKQQSRQITSRDKATIGFGLPDHLGPLKPGDEVAVQLLYCPGGLQRPDDTVGMARMHHPDGLISPTLTNRLTFKLTPDLLAAKDHPTTAPAE